MAPRGRAEALKLTIPAEARRLVEKALGDTEVDHGSG